MKHSIFSLALSLALAACASEPSSTVKDENTDSQALAAALTGYWEEERGGCTAWLDVARTDDPRFIDLKTGIAGCSDSTLVQSIHFQDFELRSFEISMGPDLFMFRKIEADGLTNGTSSGHLLGIKLRESDPPAIALTLGKWSFEDGAMMQETMAFYPTKSAD